MPTFVSFECGTWTFNGRTREVTNRGGMKEFDEAEFSVLVDLLTRANSTVPREELTYWKRPHNTGDRHPSEIVVVGIRRKLGELGEDVKIETTRGIGYKLATSQQVKRIPETAPTELEQLLEIARDRIKAHSARDFEVSIRHCEEILRSGPNETAYGGLVKGLVNLGHVGLSAKFPHETMPQALSIAQKAIDEYPNSAGAYAWRGLIKAIYQFDWDGAYGDVKEALRLDSNSSWANTFMGHFEVAHRRFDSGIEAARKGAKLESTVPLSNFIVPMLLYFAERFQESESEAAGYLQRFGPFYIGHGIHGYSLSAMRAFPRAIDEYKKALANENFLPDAVARMGYCYGQMDKPSEALSCLERLRNAEQEKKIAYVSGYFEAFIWVGMREFDKAIRSLEFAFEQRCDWLIYLNVEPCWKPLKDRPEFNALLKKVRLTD